ncbi:MAG TPA: hypothetical protein VHL52_00215 [Acidimicrobiia bacterium]|nr:hypothetical protein [Acidimicrobiia bacterium]
MTTPESARFFDTRAAYLLFANATTEKAMVAERVGHELSEIQPSPPGLRVFDAGMGDASVLTQVMRQMHTVFPRIPWTVVGKEISVEDVRQALARLPDRFLEHPEMVFVVTNMRFGEATRLTPDSENHVVWREVALEGDTTHDFATQIRDLFDPLADDWKVETSPKTGNPVYVRPAVVVIYRADHEFILRSMIPRSDMAPGSYDLIIAAQPYRAAVPLERKVRTVVVPLARALTPGGRLIGIHATGRDPALEIIREVWPDVDPFRHGAKEIIEEARRHLSNDEFDFPALSEDESTIRYEMHTMPSESAEHIGTSSVLATWNAAAYVAQIDERRLSQAMRSGAWEEATRTVMGRHPEIWFEDEAYVVVRRPAASL